MIPPINHRCECHHRPTYISLYRGDDSDFAGNQEVFIELDTELDLTGCTAHFKYMGMFQNFETIPEDRKLRLVFPREQTKEMPLGAWDAELWLEDASGKRRTVSNRIHILVTNSVSEAYCGEDPQAIKANIGNEFDYNNAYNKPTLNGVVIEGNKTSRDYHIEGGGGGGTDDYNELYNKPKINGVELRGDKSSSDLRLQSELPVDPDSSIYSISTVFAQEAHRANIAVTAESAGLADFAEKAGSDGQGRDISDTYATKEDTYDKAEVDDKITRFVAHYLTTKINNRFVPFPTHAALAEAKRTHTEENPKFFYAGEGFTPTKNDYCVVLADETYDGKTTRYSYVGEWDTGSFQYQYTINDTTFSQAQWDAINSGITSELIDQTVEAINGKQDKLAVNDSGVYQIHVALADDAMNASHASVAESADIADRAIADSDGKAFATKYATILSDTLVGKIDEERHDDNISAKIIRVPVEFARTPFNAVKVSFHETPYEEGDEMYIGVGYSSGTGGSSGINYTDTILSFSHRHYSEIDPGPHVYVFDEDFLDRIPQDAKFLTFFFSTSDDIEEPYLAAAPIETGYATDEEVAQKKYQIQETDGFFHLEHAPLMEFLVADDPVARKSSVDAVGTSAASAVASAGSAIGLAAYPMSSVVGGVLKDRTINHATTGGSFTFPTRTDTNARDFVLIVNMLGTAPTITFPAGVEYISDQDAADVWTAEANKINAWYFSEVTDGVFMVCHKAMGIVAQ